ncbi:hypothetical protein E1B28_009657 [Marasmius oreades]|uniref:PSP1 C-terminal domain-containing protein n=1 Tax=Marasmius oreades TaxID=181124 RepID=A0A9P7RW51_9AGAR|nr:uncharacterized protein E1B28_009657 [Marasmius oreades]KAG7090548.1 hypothetical protein E1B28_009657 [Marasmius oreades]
MATFDQLDKLGVRFPGSTGNSNSSINEDRPNRFTTETGPPPLSHRERAASQPPRTSDQPFLSSPIIPSSRSPWSTQGNTGRLLSPTTGPGGGGGGARAIPVPIPSRSASFSTHSTQQRNSTTSSYFASTMRDRSFSSTFEDEEDLAEDYADDGGGDYDFVGRGFSNNSNSANGGGGGGMGGMSPSMNRGRQVAPEWSRSRSQSLAATTARAAPMSIGNSSYGHQAGTGSAYASWNEGLLSGSNSLNIPGTLGSGGRWGDIRSPVRNPTDISNQSPFVRDVGQILLEESSQFKQLWAQQQGRLDRDEILSSGVSRLGGTGFTRNVGSGSYLGGGGNGNIYGAIGAGLAGGYGYGGGGMGSGTSSRRHSVSVVQPRRGVQVGFDAGGGGVGQNEVFGDEGDSPRGVNENTLVGMPMASGGAGAGNSSSGTGGAGGLMLSDEDLLGPGGDMGMRMLNLNSRLDAHLQSQREGTSPSQRDSQQHTPQSHAPGNASASSSLPIYAPLSRSPPAADDLVSNYRTLTLNPNVAGDGSSRGHTPSDRGVSPGQPQQQQQQHFFPSQSGPHQQQQFNPPHNEGSYATRVRAPSQSGGMGGPASPISPTGGSRGAGIGLVQAITQQQQQAYFGHPQHPQHQQQPHPHSPHHHHQQQQQQQQQGHHGQHARQVSNSQDAGEQGLGKGLPLSSVPSSWPLFIVEFKAGRTDLFYLTDQVASNLTQSQMNGHVGEKPVKVGDLVIVEADRGRDLGRVVNDCITVNEVERWLETREHQQGQFGSQWGDQPMSPGGAGGGGGSAKKEINPKMIYGKAGAQEATQLAIKMQDEAKALQLCQSKVRSKKLPMEVVDAEYQWDRRKLTFYFVAEKRIDFRELVRELFRLYKTRIWMASLQSSGGFEL